MGKIGLARFSYQATHRDIRSVVQGLFDVGLAERQNPEEDVRGEYLLPVVEPGLVAVDVVLAHQVLAVRGRLVL